MTEREAFLAIRNAIRLEGISRKAAAKITPQLREAFKVLRVEISEWPEGKIEREMVYKQLYRRMPALFGGINNSFYQELTNTLREETGEQLAWAAKMLGEGGSIGQDAAGFRATLGSSPVQQVALGFGQNVPTATQLSVLVDDVQVLGQTLETLFKPQPDGATMWIKTQMKTIDRVVKQGFLSGATNDQIARDLVGAMGRTEAGAKAVARTAVMDMSQRAHNNFWDANADRIKLWEFDATFDYRVCPQCYPHDGDRAKDRSSLPSVPRHPNCRCRILPLTATSLALEKEQLREGVEMSIVDINSPGEKPVGRVYKTPARVDGRRMIKSAREIEVPRGKRPSMGYFLDKATPETREAVLGKVRAEEFNWLTSSQRGPRRKDVDEALRVVTTGDVTSFARAQRARSRR